MLTKLRRACAGIRSLPFPALNELPQLLPGPTRFVYYRIARLDPAAVHEWLCESGLCPCGVDLDVEAVIAAAEEIAAAVSVA